MPRRRLMGMKVGMAVTVVSLLAACSSSANVFSSVQPGMAANADRTITIMAVNGLRFDPDHVSVRRGETVTFQVDNVSSVTHEFDVGTAVYQASHEKEMEAMPAGMVMSDEPTAIVVNPGQTKDLTLSFAGTGTIIYGCHQPGHYAAGMKGDISVA